ncbi:YraN family protein [Candidatus Omnitrophota bacterium]
MPELNLELGQKGEQLAAAFLKSRGYNIVETNYHTRLGQIDIIAKDKRTICFVEVKTRKTQEFGHPAEAIDSCKQRKISQVALTFLKEKGFLNYPARFDIVLISYPDIEPKIELLRNAFELDYHYLY